VPQSTPIVHISKADDVLWPVRSVDRRHLDDVLRYRQEHPLNVTPDAVSSRA